MVKQILSTNHITPSLNFEIVIFKYLYYKGDIVKMLIDLLIKKSLSNLYEMRAFPQLIEVKSKISGDIDFEQKFLYKNRLR